MRDSPPNSLEDEADAGDLENPTIPLHDFEDHLRYQLTMPRRKSAQSLIDNAPQNRHHSRRQNDPTNLEDRKPSGGSGSGDRSSDEQYNVPFGRKQLSSLYQQQCMGSNEGLRENPFREKSKFGNVKDNSSRSRS